jgi:rhamnosyltransferase subunit B
MKNNQAQESKRIVLAAWGSHGDVLPFVGLGKQLLALGHRPVLAASTHYQALALEHGLAFAPVAPHHAQWARDLGLSITEVMRRAFDPWSGALFLIKKLMLPYIEQTFKDLDAACEGADLLIAHPSVPQAHLVAHQRQIPWNSMIVQPFPLSAMSAQDPPVVSNFLPLHKLKNLIGERGYRAVFEATKAMGRGLVKPLDDKARELGIYDKKKHPLYERVFSPHGTLAMFSPVLMRQPLPTDLPHGINYAGFSYFDGGLSELPAEVQEFLKQGDPPIAFTLGSSTMFNVDAFFSKCSDVCKALGVRAVFLVADHQMKHELPASQIAAPWVSVAALFPHCKAAVTAGGIGSCAQALRAGLPQLIVPYSFDQPDNAARFARAQGSLVLKPWQAEGKRLALALHRLVNDASLRDRTQRLRQQINRECGTIVAADLVHRRLTGRSGTAQQKAA